MYKIIQMAFAFIGVIVGAGFASGNEILQYFTSFGAWGTAGAVLLNCTPKVGHNFGVFLYGEVFF